MPQAEETETVITWTAADEKATVHSLMPKVWRQCIRAGGVQIDHEQGVRDGRKAARTFLVDPECIVIRRPAKRNLTPLQRETLRERARGLRSRRQDTVLEDPNAPATARGTTRPHKECRSQAVV